MSVKYVLPAVECTQHSELLAVTTTSSGHSKLEAKRETGSGRGKGKGLMFFKKIFRC